MGDAAVSALVKDVIGRLTSELIKEFALLWGFKGDIMRLKEDFEQIQAVLEDAEEKHIKEKAVELWLQCLRSASFKVENVLDDISTEALLRSLHKEIDIERGIKIGIKYKVRASFSKFKFRVRAAHKVKAIRTKLDDIASRRFELNLISSDTSHEDVGVEGEMPNRETSSLILDSSKILGKDEEVEMVIRTVCNKDIGKYDNGDIRVYGIWGMGGLGKTTLAQLVYNHKRVDQYFDLKCWVYVSENFQVNEIMKKIIESVDKSGCTLTQLDTLQASLQNKLMGRKFLIVLDDVWAEENEEGKWKTLSGTLSCGEEGSIVVMTTRSERTCRMMAKVGELRHELGCLSEENSWLLFKKHAFAEGRVGDDERKLEPIGREIVVKCKGLPLAVKTLGSLMWSKSSSNDWQRVKDSNIWNLQENNVLPALKLSYDNLAPHLKRCFSYFCLFPKGYELEKDELILLWVANGFIPPREETDNLYVIGEESFNCLVWKSLFQVDDDDTCKMHDLVHDMARHVMKHDCLVIEPACNEVKIPDEVLHLSSSCPDEKLILSSEDLGKLTSLRSIFMFGEEDEGCISQLFKHMYVRVLHLDLTRLRTLPESICKLKHLRYFNLSNSSIDALPESIMYLQNLQVLILCWCRRLRKLPESICKLRYLKYLTLFGSGIEVLPDGLKDMISLQRLDINGCYSLRHFPCGIEKLTSLRMLPRFPVGKEIGAKISELGDLNLLKGELKIEELKNVEGLSEAKSANLKCKKNLSILVLKWSEELYTPEMFPYMEEVLEGLEPNPSLEILKVENYMGKTISPSWMDNLRNLVEIVFDKCKNCERLPPLGRLPSLRVIQLSYMYSLKCFHDDDINMSVDNTDMFICLQRLKIIWCRELISLPDNLPKLVDLELKKCEKLISLPCNLPSIRKMKFEDCDGLLSLPDEIQSFKDLNKLAIRSCKHLSKRYNRYMGEDWHKVSHIPDLSFNAPS
ncbi:putative virus X resistance protein-like, coiled-coil [Helianthus annuus]|uniref:Virus X resistance protein-like, coiled-coil n=1 Tax=Helianthus annuus TaxID=4232 RepID=A0A9K3JY17_HELAN|nr:disease resistance protein RGA2-like [Helianthus annuus]KAF5823783.1 putative virus X resistance protein-like, coiled-coil [Helianthus annuus]KAJ0613142.1 putative virus X resistance protein-like, coiled-coil [Helianthus annuus]KAJ0784816.1 putative virus X resistance protein-like, coiled-coil [Helianthus annuus]KAJ0794010.1 putative virus X resistance protein-like, coiled-coil [Helianthus annuus]KAJ0794083.1 putative virus X resistance protein-like, coiled-coil [Helianthus annuus]